MKSSTVKRFCEEVLNLSVNVRTINSKAGWIEAGFRLERTEGNTMKFKGSFPEEFRRLCIKTVYPNSPQLHQQVSAGNITGSNIAMLPHEWEQVISVMTHQGSTPQD